MEWDPRQIDVHDYNAIIHLNKTESLGECISVWE